MSNTVLKAGTAAEIALAAGLRCVQYIDLPLWTGSLDAAAEWLAALGAGAGSSPGWTHVVTHINANNYYRLHHEPQFGAELRDGGLMILDGIGLKIGGFLLGLGRLPDLNGTDLFPLVMQRAAARNLKVFLLGAHERVAATAASNLGRRFPGIGIAGFQGGYFDAAEETEVAARVRASGAQVLLLGRGFLRQERFALDHAGRLGVNLIWNVGGLFDFVSGAKSRAPRPLRRLRLEWLYRFMSSPRGMWHRNLVAAPWFLGHVVHARFSAASAPRCPACAAGDPATEMQKS